MKISLVKIKEKGLAHTAFIKKSAKISKKPPFKKEVFSF